MIESHQPKIIFTSIWYINLSNTPVWYGIIKMEALFATNTKLYD